MNKRAPWSDNRFLDYLTQVRNDAVEKLIVQKLVEDDPLGDQDAEAKFDGYRNRAFAEAEIPECITVECDAFTAQDGKRYPVFNATLVATPNRGSVVNILLNETHLDWLLAAISASEQFDIKEKSNKRFDDSSNDLPELEHPNVKWRKRGANAEAILCCEYTLADGTPKTHFKTVPKVDDEDAYRLLVKGAAAQVQEYYDKHNVQLLAVGS